VTFALLVFSTRLKPSLNTPVPVVSLWWMSGPFVALLLAMIVLETVTDESA
jgi:hypothetical protein